MSKPVTDNVVIRRLVEWAENRADIRAMLLTSSRANPRAPVDAFSDYDVVLVVTDLRPYFDDKSYLGDYGPVLVVFNNPIGQENGFDCFGAITHYEDGTKIDYGFFPVEWLRWVTEQPELPPDLDAGYVVLLDKDHLADGLKPPTYAAYIPTPPTEQEYRDLIQEFWNDAAYTAKNLWRDNLISAKYNLDTIMKFHVLRQLLEWRMEIEHGWSVRPGAYGKGLKKWMDPALWTELESTYVDAGIEENWDALFRTVDLFRKVAVEVGDSLGYSYPEDLDRRMVTYLHRVKDLDRAAASFSGLADPDGESIERE
jgi:aminoglycoside 6-adenylyltransferase